VAWAEAAGQNQGAETFLALDIQPPSSQTELANQGSITMGMIMAGMMIFFTGAGTAESIIREDEDGTLARLFTTPTSRAAILGAKFTAYLLNILG